MFLTHNIIGDPEFEMWLGKPDTLDFSYTCGGKAINILWPASYGTTVCVSNGTGETRSAFLTGRPIKGFASGFIDGDFAISVWQTGKLPMIRYFGQNATLAGVKKSYIVRDALLGSSWEGEAASKFKVALQAVLSVRAIDSITSTELLKWKTGDSRTEMRQARQSRRVYGQKRRHVGRRRRDRDPRPRIQHRERRNSHNKNETITTRHGR